MALLPHLIINFLSFFWVGMSEPPTDSVALVTAASSVIGEATAHEFATRTRAIYQDIFCSERENT